MNTNELALTLIKEAFHSFEIGDNFTKEMLLDIAYYKQIQGEISRKAMTKKVEGFIQCKKKTGMIKCTDKKWGRYKVYEKTSNLVNYRIKTIKPIPKEYHDFVYIWNEMNCGESVTCDKFKEILDEFEIEETYEGQVSKFLWVISARGLAGCKGNYNDSGRNVYIRADSIPDFLLRMKTTKFMKVPDGEYQSCLDELQL